MLTILRTLPGQRGVPFLAPAKIAELRDARVRETVRYAAETVPYYRELFAREGIDPREIRSADDLAELPVIDKSVLNEDPSRFRSQSAAGHDVVAFRTSGYATGYPHDIFHDRRSLLANIAFSERERAVEAAYCGRRFRYSGAHLRYDPAAVTQVQAFYDGAAFRPLRPRHHPIAIEPSVERVVEILNSVRPDAIRSYGTYLEAFFRIVAARDLTLHRPKVLVYGGDRMTTEGRALIENRFGVPVLSRYSAIEAFKIGYFCEVRDGFHLHEDLCHVVLVDADGRPVPAGEPGEVMISNLVNRGTVLLNYKLGDLGRMTAEPCTCGRTFRRLLDLDGRVTDVVQLPSGDVVHQFALWGVIKLVEGVIRYQLVQHEPARFELSLMTVDRTTYDRVADEIAAQVRDLLQGADVEATYRELLELGPRGKFKPIVPLTSP
jgi:phenylacetate-coenzyme A ligase PaaK-like adenylate-forming protein